MSDDRNENLNDVAIVGMEARVPGARRSRSSGATCADGVESVAVLRRRSPPGGPRRGWPTCKAVPLLEDIELFDASFFGFNPREAEVMDPQIRALPGVRVGTRLGATPAATPHSFPGRIGVFAGAAFSTYSRATCPERRGDARRGRWRTRSSYGSLQRSRLPRHPRRLQARPPRARAHRADLLLDLAGGRAPGLPEPAERRVRHGARRRRRRSTSPAGTATSTRRAGSSRPTATAAPSTRRPRARSSATASGVVVLKRLADALADGDPIHAVIRGQRRQQRRRRKGGLHRAQRRRPGRRSSRRRMAIAGVAPETDRLRRGARHRHRARRPDRDRGADPRVPRRHRRGAASARSAR